MHSKLLIPGLVVTMLGMTACGGGSSSSSSSSSAATSSSASTSTPAATTKKAKGQKKASVPSRTYRLQLSGKAETPPGAPEGTGAAVIALHGGTLQLCWRFAHLRGFTGATFAHIHRGAKGTSGPIVVPLSTGPKLHHKGCVRTTATMIRAIEKDPHGYYVNIHSRRYPGGAVRSQL
jgi:hypothetical protein